MITITLSDTERMELGRRASSRAGRVDDARPAWLILLIASGDTWATIRSQIDCNDAFIDLWSNRFVEE